MFFVPLSNKRGPVGLSKDQMLGRTSMDPRWHTIYEDGSPYPGERYPTMVALRTGLPARDQIMGVFNPRTERYAWISISAVPETRPGEDTPFQVYATFEDITLRKEAQAELERYRRQLEQLVAERTAALEAANRHLRRSDLRREAMFELSERASELSEHDLLQLAINEAVRLTASTIGYLHFVSEDQESVELACWSEGVLHVCSAVHNTHYPIASAGVWADAVRTLAPVVHNDYQGLGYRWSYPAGHVVLERHLGVPVIEDGKVRLLLGVGNKPAEYDEVDVRELQLIGGDLWRVVMRRRAEVALRESEERYRALFESSVDALSIIDVESGQFIDCNQAAVRLYGASTREELLSQRLDQISPERQPDGAPSQQMALEYLARSIAEGSAVFEWAHCRLDGTMIPVLVSLSVMQAQGRAQVLVLGRDISEIKRTQAELERARDAAEAASRAQSAFLANMSHELRTPLNAIAGRSELLQEGIYGPLTEPQHAALSEIEAGSAHLLELFSDLLDLSQLESGQFQLARGPVEVEVVCDAALRAARDAAAAKNITLSLAIDSQVVMIDGDGRRLKQILANLLSNAVKFTPAGGRAGLGVLGNPERQTVTFTVWDTGIGIASADLARLFRPFTQLDSRLSRQYEGAGLGLALVRHLVRLHGGSIIIESRVDEGSRFSVTLPWRNT
ncbi:MAG: GAF domain-containing protein [Chloroflexales bacterium]|nr:GAF domain-containing protein [Chloroflexales bacterium]